MKLIATLLKIVLWLAAAVALAAGALLGYDRYVRNKYPVRYINPNSEEDLGL